MSATNPRPRLAVLGAGVMGGAVLAGALRAGWDRADVVATVLAEPQAEQVRSEYGVSATTDNAAAVRGAKVVLIAVKPKGVAGLLAEIRDHIDPGAVVVSVVVGLPCAFYESRLPDGVAVVRVMPNTPVLVGSGVSAISGGRAATKEHVGLVEDLLGSTGTVLRVAEADQDAVAALSGSGPAYAFYVIDALAEAGVLLGLSRAVALQLATATLGGAVAMLNETGEHPVILRERVSSPGGTTVAALRELDAGGVRAAFLSALVAARDKSQALAEQLGQES